MSSLGVKKVGDLIRTRQGICRIERVVGGDTVVLQEMGRDSLGRLRSIGEDGRFSSTVGAVRGAPLYRRKGSRKKVS